MFLQEINSEEIGAARMSGSSIVKHVRSIVGYHINGTMPYCYDAVCWQICDDIYSKGEINNGFEKN